MGALAFLSRRAVEGVELVESGVYRRTISAGGLDGTLTVGHDQRRLALIVTVCAPLQLSRIVSGRVRQMFDLDADTLAIVAHLREDPLLQPLVAAHPAPRVFRGWEGFEVAARSIIGQQVSVARARHLNGVLVDRCGGTASATVHPELRRIFPTPRQVLDGDLSGMGMPGARVAALKAVAAASLADPQLFQRGCSLDATLARLRSIRGIGEWTAQYIAMRACGEPDAFPAGDVGLLRGAADVAGRRPTPLELRERAERWRPWRAYAAHCLWARDSSMLDRDRRKLRSVRKN